MASRNAARTWSRSLTKLSALSPRYQAVQEDRVWEELYPRILRLALIAAKYDINYTIDAEEA